MTRLYVYGDLNADICLHARTFPQPGQDSVVDDLAILPGGSAANCAATAARLGVSVELIGVTGQDALSEILVADLAASGVGLAHLQRVEAPPGVIVAIISDPGERTFFSYRGANALPVQTETMVRFQGGDILHLSGYSFQDANSRAAATRLMAQARAEQARLSLDPSFQFARDPRALTLIGGVDFLFPNEVEARLLTGETDPARAAARLHERGAGTVVLKLGAAGCFLYTAKLQESILAYPVARVADTIGAGDAFCGGFLAGILWGLDEGLSARVGNVAAACVIEQQGGHQGAPRLDEVIARVAHNGDHHLAARLRQVRLTNT